MNHQTQCIMYYVLCTVGHTQSFTVTELQSNKCNLRKYCHFQTFFQIYYQVDTATHMEELGHLRRLQNIFMVRW